MIRGGVAIEEEDGLYLGKKPDFYVDEILRYEYLSLSDRRKPSIVSNEDNFYDVEVYKQKLDLFVDNFFQIFLYLLADVLKLLLLLI